MQLTAAVCNSWLLTRLTRLRKGRGKWMWPFTKYSATKTLGLLAACAFSLSAGQLQAETGRAASTDRIVHPPIVREMSSPSGRYVLMLTNCDNWKTPRVRAELYENLPEERRSVWSRLLPHEQGPRTAVVADSGVVLLVDEWINVVSRYALTVIAVDSHDIARYSAEDLFGLLDVPRKSISAHADNGVWMTGQPVLIDNGAAVEFRTGGRRLTVDLIDGRLSVSN